jgi:hypothetical protein
MAKELLERALRIKETFYGPDHFEVAKTVVNLAILFGELGNDEKKSELLLRALPILEKHYGPDRVAVAKSRINLDIAYGGQGNNEKRRNCCNVF